MKEDILEKLQTVLFAQNEFSEAETLYILAEIRKILEHAKNEDTSRFRTLSFYCDWALHVKLTRGPAKHVLQELGDKWLSDEASEIISFERFRDELLIFLDEYNLPNSITERGSNWFEFRRNLIQLIMGAPIAREDTRIRKFSLLKKPETSENLLPSDDYLFWYQAVFDTGEVEEWNIMLADMGEERKEQITKANQEFMQRFVDKMKYRRRPEG